MIAELPPNFLQSKQWAKTNELIGHKILQEKFNDNITYMIVKSAKRGRYLEIPGGPLVDWSDKKAVETAFAKIRELAKKERCAFVRLRPQLLKSPESLALLKSAGAVPAPMHLHAEHTVILDLEKSEDDLLAAMRRQTRYEVRRATNKFNIKVTHDNSEALFREFHAAQTLTASRQHFIPPDLKTLLAEREAFGNDIQIYVASTDVDDTQGENSHARLADENFIAAGSAEVTTEQIGATPVTTGGRDHCPQNEHSRKASRSDAELGARSGSIDRPIAYGLILTTNEESIYFEAASTDLNKKLPGAYGLQWQVIKDLKKQGIKRYNLWGIAPPGAANHRYSGVTVFKTGFGGDVVEFVPAHDLIISPARYKLDFAVETLRKKRRKL